MTDLALELDSVWAVLPWLTAALVALAWLRRQAAPAQARAQHWALLLCRLGVLAALVAIGTNPVHVTVTPDPIHRPEVHVLLDASQSMRLGSPESRWEESTALLSAALERQGRTLQAVWQLGFG